MPINAPRSRTIVLTDAGTSPFSAALVDYDGTIGGGTPIPAPVFTTPSSIAADGTPQVGELLTGIDGVASDTTSYTRRWLLGSTVLTSSAAYTPSAVGTYRYETIATGPGGETTSGSNITVAAASPVLNALTISPSTATVGTSTTITISGATAGSVITGTVPAGMTLNSAARTITGTPTTAGSPSIVLTETLAGATGSPRQSTIGVTIAAAPVTPSLNALTVSPSSATVGTAYSGTINGLTSGSSIALSGAGAAGLSIAGAVITGTPTTVGAVNIIETLAGATGSPRTSSGVITVAAAAVVLNPLTLSPTTATVGTAYTGTVSGKTSGSALTLSGTGAAGLTVSGSTVSGTPTTAGSVNIIETLAGATGSPRTSSGVLTVSAASSLPSTVQVIAEGDSITTGLGGSGGITSYVDLAMTNNASQLPGFATGNTGSTTYTYRKVSQSGETALSMANGYSGAGGSTIIAAGAGPAGPGGGQGIGAGPSYDATKAMNIVSIHAGTNDNTISAEVQIYRALRSYQRQARATGFERSIGSTIISRTNATFNSTDNGVDHNFDGNTVPINLSIRQYWNSDLGYDYLCDFAADPAYDTAAHFVDKSGDGTHPNDAGYSRMGAIYLAGLQAVITQATRTPRVQGLTFSKYDIGGNGILSADLKTLTVTISGSTRSTVRGLPRMPVGSGKWYWEMVTNNPTQTQLGLCTEGFEPFIYAKNGDLYTATASGGQAIAMYGDTTAYNGTVLSGTYFPAAGDITQYCFDADTGLMWFRTKKASGGTFTNWNANASADPATLTGGIDIRTGKLGTVSISPAATIGNANTTGITSRFASADQTLRYAGIAAFRSFDTATVAG